MLKIRAATSRDDLTALWEEVYRDDYAPLLPLDVHLPFEPRGDAYVAEIGGTVAAFCYVDGEWLDELWVRRPFQGRGVGTALVRHAEEVMRMAGFESGRLSVLRTNVRAIALYKRLGWNEARTFQDNKSGVWNLLLVRKLAI